jgi:hypothetical protein
MINVIFSLTYHTNVLIFRKNNVAVLKHLESSATLPFEIFDQYETAEGMCTFVFVYSKSEYTLESVSVSGRPAVRPFTR